MYLLVPSAEWGACDKGGALIGYLSSLLLGRNICSLPHAHMAVSSWVFAVGHHAIRLSEEDQKLRKQLESLVEMERPKVLWENVAGLDHAKNVLRHSSILPMM